MGDKDGFLQGAEFFFFRNTDVAEKECYFVAVSYL